MVLIVWLIANFTITPDFATWEEAKAECGWAIAAWIAFPVLISIYMTVCEYIALKEEHEKDDLS